MLKNKKMIDWNDEEIVTLIEKEWGDFEQVVHTQVGHLMPQYLKWRRRSRGTIFLTCFILSALFLGSVSENELVLMSSITLFFILFFISLVISGWVLWRWSKVSREFNKVFNPIVFEKALQILGFTGVHMTEESVTQSEIIALLDHSELITERRNRYDVDDMLSADYYGRSLFLAELAVRYVSFSGENRRTKLVFHGFFAVHDLPRSLKGKTFVTTEGDKQGFGNMSWWQWFKAKESPQETLLEWNDFENKLHVATTNEIEARYILTPDFMQELYDWWNSRGGNIRISFLDNRMYLLFPDRNVRIGSSTVSFSEKDLKHYLLTVVRPLWHLQQLMEHAEERLHRL